MTRVIVSPSADADLDAILTDLIKAAGVSIADRYLARFEELYDRLAEFPASYARRRDLGKDVRVGIVSPYMVIYQHVEVDDTVNVLRVVHGRRNITPELI
jgi:toxin ParE1/3/4